MSNVILTISGPSGSGKSTLEMMLSKREGFRCLIGTTTRPMRDGEINGYDYHFIDKAQFQTKLCDGLFVETNAYNDNMYGLYKSELHTLKDDPTRPGVFVCDPNGKDNVTKYANEIGLKVIRVFLDVTPQTQMERLLDRFYNMIDSRFKNYLSYYEEKLINFASRMVAVAGVERAWLADAYDKSKYDIVIPQFDSATELSVINSLTRLVDEQLMLKSEKVVNEVVES